MERAGRAAFEHARALLGTSGRRVLVFTGPGNNGGDGFVLARLLRQHWYEVALVSATPLQRLPADARAGATAWLASGGSLSAQLPQGFQADLAVDAIFGIGLSRAPEGLHASWIEALASTHVPVLALDVPSGLDADTGKVHGRAVRATHTVSFLALKPGLLTLEGPDHAGTVHLATLGVDARALLAPPGHVVGPELLRGALAPRLRNSHKGTYGTVGVVGGAPGMAGAAVLCALCALKLGAGRVLLGLVDERAGSLVATAPELMVRAAAPVIAATDLACLALGPGLGTEAVSVELLEAALHRDLPLVLDADALNLLARNAHLAERCRRRQGATILTPHPAEAARLAGTGTADIQADRVAGAVELARRLRACVVLKGAGSVIAEPSGAWAVNPTGNPGMAAAGMGDVLTGIIAALLAQGLGSGPAAAAGAWLHGHAGDALRERLGGPVGLQASELIDEARLALNALIYARPTK